MRVLAVLAVVCGAVADDVGPPPESAVGQVQTMCEGNGPLVKLLVDRVPSLPGFSSVQQYMRDSPVLAPTLVEVQSAAATTGSSSACFISLVLSISTLAANIASIWFALKVNTFFNDLCRHCHVKQLLRSARPQTLKATVPEGRQPGDIIDIRVAGDGWQDKNRMSVQLPPEAKPGTQLLIVTDDSARTSAMCQLCGTGGKHWETFKKYVILYFMFDIFASIAMQFCSLKTTSSTVQYLVAVETAYMGPHFWPLHAARSAEVAGPTTVSSSERDATKGQAVPAA